jgi:hypothetical protein
MVGSKYVAFLEKGESIKDLSIRFNVTPTSVHHAVKNYQAHIYMYNTDDVYRRLYDSYIMLFNDDENMNGLLTRAYTALRRSGLDTVEKIESNKDKILNNLIRNVGAKSSSLIIHAFLTEKILDTDDEIPMYATELNRLFDIDIETINRYFNNKNLLKDSISKKIDLALFYIRDRDNDFSKYSKVSTYIEYAVKNFNSLDRVEVFYKNLARLGTTNTLSIVKYVISQL